jgi:hypothetical protein
MVSRQRYELVASPVGLIEAEDAAAVRESSIVRCKVCRHRGDFQSVYSYELYSQRQGYRSKLYAVAPIFPLALVRANSGQRIALREPHPA